jgi:predicted GIY-YIG superfamily endonuclease
MRLGSRAVACRAEALAKADEGEGGLVMKYVYILQSVTEGEHFYTGVTDDLRARLTKHNSGEVTHASKYRPWRVKTYVAFTDADRAHAFEKYLKSGSGRAFAKARL